MEENRSLLNNFGVDPEGSNQLLETARWSKFFGVLTLIAIGLFVLLAAFFWTSILEAMALTNPSVEAAGATAILIGVFVIVFAIVAILLVFLIKGATRIKQGILNKDQVLFISGLSNLKNYFVMVGVITVLQFVFFLFGLIGGGN